MKQREIEQLSVDELVNEFEVAALAQDQALLYDDIRRVNRLFDRLEAIEAELKLRDGDARRALISLFDHLNPQVRVKAAKATLAVAPRKARQMLKELSTSSIYPQAGEAGMSLRALESGIFKPE